MAHLIHSALPHPRRPITYVTENTSLSDCIKLMTDQDIGALVVKDDQHQLVGILSERDIVRNCLYKHLDPQRLTAKDVVFKNVSILSSNESIDEAMEVITTTKRRYILITEDGQLMAILSIGDLLFHLLDDKSKVIEQLENYIHTY